MAIPDALLVAMGGNATPPDGIRGTTEEQAYQRAGQFARGSMGPKVEAAALRPLAGENGTHVVRG